MSPALLREIGEQRDGSWWVGRTARLLGVADRTVDIPQLSRPDDIRPSQMSVLAATCLANNRPARD